MKNIHSFKTFEIDRNVYMAGDAPKPVPEAPTDVNAPTYEQLEKAAISHVQNAKSFLEGVAFDFSMKRPGVNNNPMQIHYEDSNFDYTQYLGKDKKAKDLSSAINTVLKNIQYLQEAIDSHAVTQNVLEASRMSMELAKKFHDPSRVVRSERQVAEGDPLAAVVAAQIRPADYAIPTQREKVEPKKQEPLYVLEDRLARIQEQYSLLPINAKSSDLPGVKVMIAQIARLQAEIAKRKPESGGRQPEKVAATPPGVRIAQAAQELHLLRPANPKDKADVAAYQAKYVRLSKAIVEAAQQMGVKDHSIYEPANGDVLVVREGKTILVIPFGGSEVAGTSAREGWRSVAVGGTESDRKALLNPQQYIDRFRRETARRA